MEDGSIVTFVMEKEMLENYIKIQSDDSFSYNMKILHIVNAAGKTISYQEAKKMIEEVIKDGYSNKQNN